jgi:hypothetical protein
MNTSGRVLRPRIANGIEEWRASSRTPENCSTKYAAARQQPLERAGAQTARNPAISMSFGSERKKRLAISVSRLHGDLSIG